MRTRIKKIVGVREFKPDKFITTIIDEEGNQATGVGEFRVGDPIMIFMDDRYNKLKFVLDFKSIESA